MPSHPLSVHRAAAVQGTLLAFALLAFALSGLALSPSALPAQRAAAAPARSAVDTTALERLTFRAIGPANMMGRATDVEGVAGNSALGNYIFLCSQCNQCSII